MEKSERETHDFMNVESFSQLPFIRPAPVKEKGIRLFGKEFGGGDYSNIIISTTTTTDHEQSTDDQSGDHDHHQETTNTNNNSKDSGHDQNVGESTRKFECHYCCRNFPTSQALGGHQNAHKRERQHAKRAHLQSAMMHGGLAAEAAHVYGLMNYHHRLTASVPATTTTPPLPNYHSAWSTKTNTTSTANSSRFYGGGGGHGSYSHQPPINGSPLALWRIPAAQYPNNGSSNLISSSTTSRDGSMHHHHHHHPLPLLPNDHHHDQYFNPPAQQLIGSINSQTRPNKMQDHVSLDLHL